MKLISVLIIIYVLYLVSLPCKDDILYQGSMFHTETNHQDHPADHDHADGCSPFCICSCCSVTVIVSAFHFESIPFYIPVQPNFILKEGKPAQYFRPVWEPPKKA